MCYLCVPPPRLAAGPFRWRSFWNAHTYAYGSGCNCVYLYICISARVYACIHTVTQSHARAHTHTHTHTHARARTHTHGCGCNCVYLYTVSGRNFGDLPPAMSSPKWISVILRFLHQPDPSRIHRRAGKGRGRAVGGRSRGCKCWG